MAERVGFEPTVLLLGSTLDFESSAFNRTQPSLHTGIYLLLSLSINSSNEITEKSFVLAYYKMIYPAWDCPSCGQQIQWLYRDNYEHILNKTHNCQY